MKVFVSTKQSYLFQHLPRAKINWTLLTLRKVEGLQMLESMYMLNVLLAYYARSILFFKGHFQLMVMADRGFAIHESVWFHQAELSIPAFTKGKNQLDPTDLEKTRGIANVRIHVHVECVIGLLRQKYTVLQGTLPIDGNGR